MKDNNKRGKELQELLADSKDRIARGFDKKRINEIVNDSVRNRLTRLVSEKITPLADEIDHAREMVGSPVHVGIIGRYSHGKTALVNSTFALDEDCRMPEGEGIVTSKVTAVSFGSGEGMASAWEIHKDGRERQIDLPMLRSCIGRTDVDCSTVDYYRLLLPTYGKDFAELFARKHIHLIDMPGLGGAYFRDTLQTRTYISNLDMLIVVIRMDEIRQAGLSMNTLLDETHLPVIPVLTFSDKWQESDQYADCADIEEAVAKAGRMVAEEIPSVAPYLNSLIAVSSVNGFNIGEFRSLILSYLESSQIAIGKARRDISPVYKKQIQGFVNEYTHLRTMLASVSEDMDEMIESVVPVSQWEKTDLIEEAMKDRSVVRADRALSDESYRGLRELDARYRASVGLIDGQTDWNGVEREVNRIERDANSAIIGDWVERLESSFSSYKNEVSETVLKSLSRLSMDESVKDDLRKNIDDIVENSSLGLEKELKVTIDRSGLLRSMSEEKAKGAAKLVLDFVKQPESIIPLIIGIGLLFVPVFKNILMPLGLLLIVVSVFGYLLTHGNRDRELFNDAKQKYRESVLNSFDTGAMGEKAKEAIRREKARFLQDIRSLVDKEMSTYKSDIRILTGMKDSAEESMRILSNELANELSELSVKKYC